MTTCILLRVVKRTAYKETLVALEPPALASNESRSHLVFIKRQTKEGSRHPKYRYTLQKEIDIYKCLSHPGLLRCLGYGRTGQCLYLKLEYEQAATLVDLSRQLRKTGCRMPEEVAVSIAVRILDALSAVHEHSCRAVHPTPPIHGDLNQSNILLTCDGRVKVIDFEGGPAGSSRRADPVSILTQVTAPEQFLGEMRGPRTDVYAVGVLLFMMLTQRDFWRSSKRSGAARLHHLRTNTTSVPSDTDPGLTKYDRVVRTATALDPDARYASARKMRDDLLLRYPLASGSDVYMRDSLCTLLKSVELSR